MNTFPSTVEELKGTLSEIAFDRVRNQKLKIHFWATCCIGNIRMAIAVFIYRYRLIFLANKKRSFNPTFKQDKLG